MIFGGAEFLIELIQIVDVPNFTKTFIEFCQYYNATNAVCACYVSFIMYRLELTRMKANAAVR
jgi:hypothetical protein